MIEHIAQEFDSGSFSCREGVGVIIVMGAQNPVGILVDVIFVRPAQQKNRQSLS